MILTQYMFFSVSVKCPSAPQYIPLVVHEVHDTFYLLSVPDT